MNHMLITIQIIKVDADLQVHLMSLCNCTDIMIHGISFECISDMMASYSFLITGEQALGAAETFNHSIATQGQLITDDGISFSTDSSLKDVAATSSSSHEDDADTIDLHILILVIVIVITVGVIVAVAIMAITM